MPARRAPPPWAPAPPAKALRPPTKPVAAPVLAQGWASPETSECPVAAGGFPGQDWECGLTLAPARPPATASRCPEPARSSTLNSERFPQPTQQIKDIVRQYQQPPRGARPEALRSAALHTRPPGGPAHPGVPSAGLADARPQPPLGRESVHTAGPEEPSGTGGPRPPSGWCCDPAPASAPLWALAMGVEEEVPCGGRLCLGRGDSVSSPPGRTAGECS